MTKEELRIHMKNKRNSLTPEELLRQNRCIRNRLFESEAYQSCKLLFSYLSFGSEADTWEIVNAALSGKAGNKKRVFLPRVEGKQMNFYEVTDLNSLKKSKFGVPEPDDSHQKPYLFYRRETNPGAIEHGKQAVTPEEVPKDMLMLLPGLVFDPSGNRIGYGAGYYDRYLTMNEEAGFRKLALAYDFQVRDSIPAESFDVKVDSIITPERSIDCSNKLLLMR
jgi:5-formyltetrahydrofolate cyclo-ligase